MIFTSVVTWASVALAGAALALSLYRLLKGPTALDRAVSVDVFAAGVVAAIVLLIVYWGRTDLAALLIVFVLTAFFSTITVARFVAGGVRRRPRGRVVKPVAPSVTSEEEEATS